MQDKTPSALDDLKSLKSAFFTLKVGVENSCNFLKDFVVSGKPSIIVEAEFSAFLVNLILFDTMISDDVKHSIMEDFDFKEDNKIIRICKDDTKCLEFLDFLKKYINYRVEFPIDMGEC